MKAERLRRTTETETRPRCRTLVGFVREAWHVLEPDRPFVYGWHIKAICDHLEAITSGRFLGMGIENRLLMNVPPGTMKSLLTSVFWPAWEWGPAGMPHLRYLTTSYSEDYAKRDARRMRDLIKSEWYQRLWGDKVQLVREAEMSFANSATGNREAMPFKSLTGGRGDRVIIDDPHSTETAESEADRDTAIRIFRESVSLRLNDAKTSAIVVIMQRLHERDVSGTIKSLGLPYQHLMLPMEFEPERKCTTAIFEDPRTVDGELLFPERFSAEVVERDKKVLGSYGVAGQFQQRPSPRGGLLFKRSWFKIIEAVPVGIRWVRGWDLAASQDANAARTAGVKVGKDGQGRFYIGHAIAQHEGPMGVRTMIKNIAEQDGRSVEISLPQDPGQAGKVQAQDMVAMLAGFKAFTSPETGDKITRALPVAAQAEAGNVYLVKGDWNEDYLIEMETFPTGKRMDQVDATSRGFGRLVQSPLAAMVSPIVVTAPYAPALGDHPGYG